MQTKQTSNEKGLCVTKMNKSRKLIALLLSLAMAVSAAGCSSSDTKPEAPETSSSKAQASGTVQDNTEAFRDIAGEKLFSEPVEISMMIPSHASWPYQEDWYVQNMIQEETNVTFHITSVTTDGFTDKVNLTMASGQLPDLIYFIGNAPIIQYAPQGAFVNILEHLDEMPNFKKWYEENQDFALNYLSADGGLYQFPEQGIEESNRRGWLYRKDVFDELGLAAPTNQEEFYEVLKSLKEAYPSSYPLAFRSFSNNMAQMVMLCPSWGTDYIDLTDNRYLRLDSKTNEWIFGPTEDHFKEMLQFYNKLYEEKLLIPNFLTIDTKGWQDVISNSEAFITVDYLSRIDFFNKPMRETDPDFTIAYMAPPSFGSGGLQQFSYSAKGIYGFAVSSQCKQLDKVLTYIDWMYRDDTMELLSWGREGETFLEENGAKKWIDLNTTADIRKGTGLQTYGFYQRYDYSSEMATMSDEAIAAIEEARGFDLPQQPVLAFNEEENSIKDTIGNTISNYVAEQTSKFILGERSFDTWDEYVRDIENFGLEQLKQIHEQSYARVMEQKHK